MKPNRVTKGTFHTTIIFLIVEFSYDLIDFKQLDESHYGHSLGGLVTFNHRLLAIAGYTTRSVTIPIYDFVIPPV